MCKYISSSNKLCVTQLTQWKLATKSAEKLQTRKVWLVTGFNFNQSFKLNIMFTHKEVRTTGSESSSLLWLFCSAVWIWLTCDSGWTAVMLSGEGGAWLLVWSHSGQGRKSTHTHTHTTPRISQTCSAWSGSREVMSCSQYASFLDCCTLCVQCIYLEYRTYIRYLSTRPLSLYRKGDLRQNNPL